MQVSCVDFCQKHTICLRETGGGAPIFHQVGHSLTSILLMLRYTLQHISQGIQRNGVTHKKAESLQKGEGVQRVLYVLSVQYTLPGEGTI